MFPSLSIVSALEVATRAFISLLNQRIWNDFCASVYPYTGTKIPVYMYCTCIKVLSWHTRFCQTVYSPWNYAENLQLINVRLLHYAVNKQTEKAFVNTNINNIFVD